VFVVEAGDAEEGLERRQCGRLVPGAGLHLREEVEVERSQPRVTVRQQSVWREGGLLRQPDHETQRTGAGRATHHHISLKEATVTALANGYSITGDAAIAGNGSLSNPYTGSSVTIEVAGGADLLSNIRIIFNGEQAVGHFGTDPLNGVVVYRP
jgi:hypothetical protein